MQFLEKALPNIFKADPGHFAEDTAEARELIQTTVTEANFVGSPLAETSSMLDFWRREADLGLGAEGDDSRGRLQ